MRKTKMILTVMLFTIAMSITAFGEDNVHTPNTQTVMTVVENSTDNIGPGYQDSKIIQAQQILNNLYANETDQELRNMAIDASMTLIFGISKNV